MEKRREVLIIIGILIAIISILFRKAFFGFGNWIGRTLGIPGY